MNSFFRRKYPEGSAPVTLILTFALTAAYYFVFPDIAFPLGYGVPSRYFTNAFLLTGEIDLVYDKRWSSVPESDQQIFTHTYRLGLEGFVIDRRLISFDLAGSFSQDIYSPGETITSRGFLADFSFLNERPRKGFLTNLPQPIDLRYSNFVTGDQKTQSYGVSLTYRPTENPLFSWLIIRRETEKFLKELRRQQEAATKKKKEEEEEESEEPAEEKKTPEVKQEEQQLPPKPETGPFLEYPTLLLDYDKYKDEFSNNSTDTDRFDVRAISSNKNVDLQAEYLYYKLGGSVTNKYQDLELKADLHFYDDKTTERLDVLNRVILKDENGVESLSLRNLTTWQKYVGERKKDLLSFWGNGDYFKSDISENHDVGVTGAYSKVFSPRLRDDVKVHYDQGRTDAGPVYDANVDNSISYILSKIFTVTNLLSVGQTELGASYEAGLGLTVTTKPVIAVMNYFYSSSALDEGRQNSHRLDLTVTGRLARNLSFQSRNYFRISDVKGTEPFKVRGFDLRTDFYWNISRYLINFGVSETTLHETTGQTAGAEIAGVPQSTSFRSTSLYSNISTYLWRNMFMTLATSYTTSSEGETTLDIHPILNWHVRQTTLSAEYEMIRRSGTTSVTDQRVLIRLTRVFEKLVKRFW
ncbi:hypothetical protein NBG4_110016 [Candidatus Sulfobium mesophilum]|uniref:Uncharacterized protein n=1 Tax=Candidatus Sulfobium mesophilum TaxID=2016548 RepID=A0A2U3QE67_9BACT|nr:hypothetical protein NBG4_110016 [Candidatus Sulfobium mesophilum]